MWREKIDKKIFESSKGKASQKERRKFIVDLKRWPDSNTGVVADNFKNMINDKEKIKKLFGENEEKSDTLKFINRIRDLIECFEAGNEEKIKKGILDLLDGKIPYGRKPSLIATVNSLDCKIIGENITLLFAGVDVDDDMHINRYDKISLSIFKMSLKRHSIKRIGFYGNNEIEFPDHFFDEVKSNMKKIKTRLQLDNHIETLKQTFGDLLFASNIKDIRKFFKDNFNEEIIQIGDKLVFDLTPIFNISSKLKKEYNNDPIQPITITYKRLNIIFFTYDKLPEKGEQYITWDADWMKFLYPTKVKQSVLWTKKSSLKEKDPNEYYIQVNSFDFNNKYTTLIKDIDFSDYK